VKRLVPFLVTMLILTGQAAQFDQPVQATVCEILGHPIAYNGKIVRVRATVDIEFEHSAFSAKECKRAEGYEWIWLEYGSGPKWQPTTWCCGDLTPRDKLNLFQDKTFRLFHRYITAQVKKKGPCEYGCPRYEVTATLTGRLDVLEPKRFPNGSMGCFGDGFGHFGSSCARLVLQSVSDVVAIDIGQKYP
jgi:hypothetical protein